MPHSRPAVVQQDSFVGLFRYAFCTSAANMSRSFRATIVKAIHTLSHVITLEYVNSLGESVHQQQEMLYR